MPLYQPRLELSKELKAEADRKAKERIRAMKAYLATDAAKRRMAFMASQETTGVSGVLAGK